MSSRIPSLDGLRAVSVFLVVGLHCLQQYDGARPVSRVWFVLLNGADGVSIFFEISGFLITTLLLAEYRKHGRISLRGFYLRRAFRILPPLYTYVGLFVALGLMGRIRLRWNDVLGALFFYYNYVRHTSMKQFEHLWSIGVEEQFYLVWPLLLVLLIKRGRLTAARVPIAILILSPFARVFFGLQGNLLGRLIGLKYLNFDFLMFGCLVALVQGTPRFEAVYRWATRIWWAPAAAIAMCSVLEMRFGRYFDLPFGYTINGAAIAMFLLWCTRNQASVVGRALNWGPVVRIGVLSYSIYLWQGLFLHPVGKVIFGSQGWVMRFPMNVVGILVFAVGSYYAVERPSLAVRDRVVRRWRLRAG
jgi:peptidoglycan/LPS O-acetylase OafA/YrhL